MCELGRYASLQAACSGQALVTRAALSDIPAPRIPLALPFGAFGHWLAQAQQETVPDA